MSRNPEVAVSDAVLTVDVGNTAIKLSVFGGETLVDSLAGSNLSAREVHEFVESHRPFRGVVCCLVGVDTVGVVDMLRREFADRFMQLDANTPVPVTVGYDRSTLGDDRLAAAVGVASPEDSVLLVDAGTAVTLDLTRGMRYVGGNISPGVNLRFEALNRFTHRLPMVSDRGEAPLFGHSTREAIRSGVERGLAYEVAGNFAQARMLDPRVRLVITGGSASIVSRYLTILNIPHDIDSHAVGRGLVRIFNFNMNSIDSNE